MWLDYVLVVATPDYVNTVLNEANVLDYTREFISKCASNHYYINTNETGTIIIISVYKKIDSNLHLLGFKGCCSTIPAKIIHFEPQDSRDGALHNLG